MSGQTRSLSTASLASVFELLHPSVIIFHLKKSKDRMEGQASHGEMPGPMVMLINTASYLASDGLDHNEIPRQNSTK